jgi:cytoskeletal protein RodZ
MTNVSPNEGLAAVPSNQESARLRLAEWLRQARERSGISIDAVSQETRISKNYILSLESGNLDGLPGKVFGRGFIKNITRLLRTDTNEGLRLYDACWDSLVITPPSENTAAEEKPAEIVASTVTAAVPKSRRLESEASPAAFVQKMPSKRRAIDSKISLKMPAWIVHTIVSPQIRLWVLTGIATVFVGLVFGRWAAGTLHKNRLVAKSQEVSMVTAKTQIDERSNVDAPLSETEKYAGKPADPMTANKEQSVLAIANPSNTNLNSAPVAAENRGAVATPQASAAEDNPLFMPSTSAAAFEQVIELRVSGDVDVKITMDGKKLEQSKFAPNSYRFTFNDRADLHLGDASLVDVIYNGKSLGSLGSKGRRRRIVLQAKASLDDFPQ